MQHVLPYLQSLSSWPGHPVLGVLPGVPNQRQVSELGTADMNPRNPEPQPTSPARSASVTGVAVPCLHVNHAFGLMGGSDGGEPAAIFEAEHKA